MTEDERPIKEQLIMEFISTANTEQVQALLHKLDQEKHRDLISEIKQIIETS